MLLYCWKRRKNEKGTILRFTKTNKEKITILSKCTVCNSNKSRFIKQQGESGLLNRLRLKAPLRKIPLLGDILFRRVLTHK